MNDAQPNKSGDIRPAALKIKPACEYLGGISEITLHRLIKRGKIRRHPGIRHILIPVSELDRFLGEVR